MSSVIRRTVCATYPETVHGMLDTSTPWPKPATATWGHLEFLQALREGGSAHCDHCVWLRRYAAPSSVSRSWELRLCCGQRRCDVARSGRAALAGCPANRSSSRPVGVGKTHVAQAYHAKLKAAAAATCASPDNSTLSGPNQREPTPILGPTHPRIHQSLVLILDDFAMREHRHAR